MDYGQAIYWYSKAAAQGDADGQCNLGIMYQFGYSGDQSYEKAAFWYEKAARQGQCMAQANLGYLYEHGLGRIQDVAAAIYWYTKAAEAGDAPAMTLLGDVYRYGRQGTVDYEWALSWYMKAADMGVPVEKLRIINCHLGNGSSLAAIKYGKVVDTTMGFTPLAGVLMELPPCIRLV